MRKLIVPAILALLAVAPGAAFAATTAAPPAATSQAEKMATGTIKSVNFIARDLTLADGTHYFLPLGMKDPGLKVGEKVTVHWKMNGSAHDVTSVTQG